MKKKLIDPLLGKSLRMTEPNSPNSPTQKYVIIGNDDQDCPYSYRYVAFFLLGFVFSKKKATCYFLLIFRIIFLFASLIFDTSMEFRYTCVVFMELCPMPSLIIGMGMSMSLAMLAHVCRAVYVVSGIFNPVISPIFFKLQLMFSNIR